MSCAQLSSTITDLQEATWLLVPLQQQGFVLFVEWLNFSAYLISTVSCNFLLNGQKDEEKNNK